MAALVTAFALLPAVALGDEALPDDSSKASPAIALLPFANYTGDGAATELFTPLIVQQLKRLGIGASDVAVTRQVLRKHRIRAVGAIDRAGAQAIARDLGIKYLLTGSIDLFVTGDVPEAGLSVRLVDATSLRVVWARSAGAAATDFTGAFGLGRITAMTELADRVVGEALEHLDDALRREFDADSTNQDRIAIVDFDDLIPASQGGKMIAAHVLSHLVARGFHVSEPGAVGEFFLAHQRIPRGSIDHELLAVLHDSLGITGVITGVVDPFRLGSPGAETSFPVIGVSARIIDAASGRVSRVAEVARDGDREIVFGIGSVRSGAKLVRSATASLLDKLQLKENRSVALR